MRTANPALNQNSFGRYDLAVEGDHQMTLQGTVNRTLVLLVLCLITATFTWNRFFETQDMAAVMPWMIGGLIGGLVIAIATIFKPNWSPFSAPLYALAEGLFLGAVSGMFELQFPGIVIQAVGLTFGTLFVLLLAYTSGVIRATENFKLGIVAATGGIMLLYMISWGLQLFGMSIPFIHESGMIGIGFSLFVVVIAALNLVLDFDFIENGVERGAPKFMEWYGAFGLMVTLVWLYLEILRLLAKLSNRD